MSDGRGRVAGGALRGPPEPPESGGLPDARVGQRGGRRRAGGLAPAKAFRRARRGEPRCMADHGRGPGMPERVAVAENAARGAAGGARARPAREPRGRARSRARGGPGGLRRSRPARGPRDAGARRAAGVRAPRYVRGPIRGDRCHPWALPSSGPAAGQPGPPRVRGAPVPDPTWPASESSSTRSWAPRAMATSRRSSRCSTRTWCSEPTAVPCLLARRG